MQKFHIEIVRYNKTELEFDLIGVHAAIANAFRRVILSEVRPEFIFLIFCSSIILIESKLFLILNNFQVPSMAIEKVKIFNNTTLLQDEVLAHRLGLIPLKADPRLFEYKAEADAEPTEQDTLEFELKIKCTWNGNAPKDATHPDELYRNHNGMFLSMDPFLICYFPYFLCYFYNNVCVTKACHSVTPNIA